MALIPLRKEKLVEDPKQIVFGGCELTNSMHDPMGHACDQGVGINVFF
jgi:hypothetical protein